MQIWSQKGNWKPKIFSKKFVRLEPYTCSGSRDELNFQRHPESQSNCKEKICLKLQFFLYSNKYLLSLQNKCLLNSNGFQRRAQYGSRDLNRLRNMICYPGYYCFMLFQAVLWLCSSLECSHEIQTSHRGQVWQDVGLAGQASEAHACPGGARCSFVGALLTCCARTKVIPGGSWHSRYCLG